MAQLTGTRTNLPPSFAPSNHGNTAAAWATVTIVILGAFVTSLGVMAASTGMAVVGLVVILIAAVVGAVLKSFGMGQPDRSGPVTSATMGS